MLQAGLIAGFPATTSSSGSRVFRGERKEKLSVPPCKSRAGEVLLILFGGGADQAAWGGGEGAE